MFFTRIRVPHWVSHSMGWLSVSTAYYPIVGVIVALGTHTITTSSLSCHDTLFIISILLFKLAVFHLSWLRGSWFQRGRGSKLFFSLWELFI
jgi:adenosylcobinamide-GDP ribazoletransferase